MLSHLCPWLVFVLGRIGTGLSRQPLCYEHRRSSSEDVVGKVGIAIYCSRPLATFGIGLSQEGFHVAPSLMCLPRRGQHFHYSKEFLAVLSWVLQLCPPCRSSRPRRATLLRWLCLQRFLRQRADPSARPSVRYSQHPSSTFLILHHKSGTPLLANYL